ncbi:MAG: hypothetical protein H7Z21_04410, partial [Hymenobacter sp.]|nr:hypothetical protein [Hymenobacter sp.]
MKLKRKVHNVLFATGCLLLLGGLAVFAGVRQASRPVGQVIVRISNEFNNFFISEREVTTLLTRGGRQRLEGRPAAELDLPALEARLKAHSFVKEAQVYRDLAGNLHADVRQNRPIARLTHPNTRQDCYLDAEGHKLPLSSLFTARVVPVA